METGGGILNAIKAGKVGQNKLPFFVINGGYWIEKQPVIVSLSNYWDPKKMDILLLLKKDLYGYEGLVILLFKENQIILEY